MRCNAWRWLWGLIPLAIVWWIGILSEHDGIEAELKRRAETALAAGNAGFAVSSFSGRDATLTGAASDAASRQAAADILGKVWGVRKVDNRISLTDKPISYSWTAARSAKGVELSGYVPSEAARQAVLANVRAVMPGVAVQDGMRIAGGVANAEQWLSSIKFGLARIAELRTGRLDVADGELSIEGEALDATRYAAVKTAFGGRLPPGLVLKSDKVTAPAVIPFTWSAHYRGKRLELAGFAPGERARDVLVGLARTGLAGGEVVSRMAIAAGEPRGWQSATSAVLPHLARMSEGRAVLIDRRLEISGSVDDAATADQIRKLLPSELPPGFNVTFDIELSSKAAAVAEAQRQRDAARLAEQEAAQEAARRAEAARRQEAAAAEAVARQRAADEDTARQRAAAEEDARRKAEAAARAKVAEDAARAKAAEDAARAKAIADAARAKAAEDAARAKAIADAARAKAAEDAARAKAIADAARAKAAEDAARAKAAAEAAARAKAAAAVPQEARVAADRCQTLLSTAARKGTINFQRASAELSPSSFATLDGLARIAAECPKVEIDIVGHTDSEGTAERNQRLSERRAAAVAAYLAEVGVDHQRLHAIGFGDSQPVAPNDTPANMAKNRRIEFVVRLN